MLSREDILANITTGPGRPSRKDILSNVTTGVNGPLINLVKGPKDTPQRTPVTTGQLLPRPEPVMIPEAPEPEPGPFEFAGPLGKFIDLVDTPRAAIVSTIKEVGDLISGEGFSPTDWWKQTEDNLFMQDVMRDWGVDLPGPLDFMLGLGLDIAFDPVTYLTGGGGAYARAGLTSNKLIDVMVKGASYYDEIAKVGVGKAGVTAAQAQRKAQVLQDAVKRVAGSNSMNAAGKEALQEVGLLGQMGLFVPTTGRLGRGMRLDKVLDAATRGGITTRRARQASRLPYIGELARPIAGKTADDAAQAAARFGREGVEDAAAAVEEIEKRMRMIAKREALPDLADDFYTAAARIASRMPVEGLKLPGFTGKVLSIVVPAFGRSKHRLMGTPMVETIDKAFNTKSSIKQGLRSRDYETIIDANKTMVSNNAGWAARNRFMDVMSKSALELRRTARRLKLEPEIVDDMFRTQLWDYVPGTNAQRTLDGLPIMNPQFERKFGVYLAEHGENVIQDFWNQGRNWMDDALINANILGGGTPWLSKSRDELWVMRQALTQSTDPEALRKLVPGQTFRDVPLMNQVDDPLKRTVEEQIRAIAVNELGANAEELFDPNIWKSMDKYLSKIGESVRRAKIMNLLEEQGVVFKEPLAWIKGQKDALRAALEKKYVARGDAFDAVFRSIDSGMDVEQIKALRIELAKQNGASATGTQYAGWVAEVELLEAKLVEIQARLVDKMSSVAGGARKSSENLADFMKPLLQEATLIGYRKTQLEAITRALSMTQKSPMSSVVDDQLLSELTEAFGNLQNKLLAVVRESKEVASIDASVNEIKGLIDALQEPLQKLADQGLLDAFDEAPKMREWLGNTFDIREVLDDNRLGLDLATVDLSSIDVKKLPVWFREVQGSWENVSAAYEGAFRRVRSEGEALKRWDQRQAMSGGILLSEQSPFVNLEATLSRGVWVRGTGISGGAESVEGAALKWSKGLSVTADSRATRYREVKFSIPSEKELKSLHRQYPATYQDIDAYRRKGPAKQAARRSQEELTEEAIQTATGMTLDERQALRRREGQEFVKSGKDVGGKPRQTLPGETAMSVRVVDGQRIIDVWLIEPAGSMQKVEEYGKTVQKWVREGWVVSVNGVPVRDVGVGGGLVKNLKEAKRVAQDEAAIRVGRSETDRMTEIRGAASEVDPELEAFGEAENLAKGFDDVPPPAAVVAAPPADWPRYKHFTTAESKAGLIESGGAFDPSLPAAHGIMGREGEWIYDQPGMAGRRLYLSLDDARWRDVEGGPAGLESVEYAIDPKARVLVLDSEAALKAAEREIKDDLVYAGERVFDKLAEAGYDVVEIRNVARNSAPPDAVEATKVQRFFEQAGGDQIVILNNDVVRFAPEGAPTARQVAAEAVTPPPAAAGGVPAELPVLSWADEGPLEVFAYNAETGRALVLPPRSGDPTPRFDWNVSIVKRHADIDGQWADPRWEGKIGDFTEGTRQVWRDRGFTFADEAAEAVTPPPAAVEDSVRVVRLDDAEVAAEAVTSPFDPVARVGQVKDWLVKAKRRGNVGGSAPTYGYMRDGKPVKNWSQVTQDLGMDAERFLMFGPAQDVAAEAMKPGRLGASEDEVLAYVRSRHLEGAVGSGRPLSWADSKPWDAAAQEKYAKKLKKYLDDLHRDLGGIEDVGSGVAPTAREVAAEAVTPPPAAVEDSVRVVRLDDAEVAAEAVTPPPAAAGNMKNAYTTETGVTFKSVRNDIRYVLTVEGDDGIRRVTKQRSREYDSILNKQRVAERPYVEAGYSPNEMPFQIETVRMEVKQPSVRQVAAEAVTPPPAAAAPTPPPAAAATRAPDPSGMYGPSGPRFEEAIVRTPYGDFRLKFSPKSRRVEIVEAPAALKGGKARTGPKESGTRLPLGPGIKFDDYFDAERKIDLWAQQVYQSRWTGLAQGATERTLGSVAQGEMAQLLNPANQGGVRQALATLTGRTETTGFSGVEGLSWMDTPMWQLPLEFGPPLPGGGFSRSAISMADRELLINAERLSSLAYASQHYQDALRAMDEGLELEAEILTMQGRMQQLNAEKALMKDAYQEVRVAAEEAVKSGKKPGRTDVAPKLYDSEFTGLDEFQAALRKFNNVRTRSLFDSALTEQTAAQWGPNTSVAGWSQGWTAPLREGNNEAPLFEMLNTLFKTTSTVGDFNGFLKWYDKFLNYWKAQAVSTPGFVLRNGLGGSWISYAFGLMELGSTNKFAGTYFRALREGRGDAVAGIENMIAELIDKKGKKTLGVGFGSRVDVNELRSISRVLDSGIVGGGQVITEVDRSVAMRLVKEARNPFTGRPVDVVFNPGSTEFAPFRFIRSANEQMETVLRGSLAFDVLQKGGSIGDAAGQVYKFHFNYADLTASERKARRIIPFWTWQKNVVPILAESIGKYPGSWGRLQQVKGNMELQSKEEGVVPDYFLENMAIRLPWKINDYQSYWIPDLPFRDLNRLMKEPTSITRVLAESAAPPVKVPLEIWAGKQFFADLPFSGRYQQVPHVYAKFPFLMQALAVVGKAKKDKKGEYKMRDQDLYMLDSWAPFLSRFRRLLPNEKRYSRRVASTVVSTVFGTQVRINDPHETRNQMIRNDRDFDMKMRDIIDIEMRVR